MDSSTPAVPHEVMERIFAPRSVAVVGVPRGMKTGRMFLEALQKPGFHGNVYPVNPNADEILGLETYPSVSAIGARIDIAIVVTPPGAAASVVEDCGKAGVAGVVMFTAGFDELGTDEGSARGAELLAVALEGRGLSTVSATRMTAPGAGDADRVQLSVARDVVIAPDCFKAGGEGRQGVSFMKGCANETILGQMIANPADLNRNRAVGPSDGEAAARAIERYRNGKTTPLLEEETTGDVL